MGPRAQRRIVWLALALLAGAVGGCGFHLREAPDIPAGLRTLYLRAPSAVVSEPLSLSLEAAGVRLAKTPAEADATLTLMQESRGRRLLSVDPRTGKAREYELSYAVSFQVVAANGSVILPKQTVRLVRDYTFDPDTVIAKSEEEELIYAEMRQDALQQVLRRLAVTAHSSGGHAAKP